MSSHALQSAIYVSSSPQSDISINNTTYFSLSKGTDNSNELGRGKNIPLKKLIAQNTSQVDLNLVKKETVMYNLPRLVSPQLWLS